MSPTAFLASCLALALLASCSGSSTGTGDSSDGGGAGGGGATARCPVSAEYCDIQHSDVASEPDVEACRPMPAACASDVSCACLLGEVVADECSASEAGRLTLEHAGG